MVNTLVQILLSTLIVSLVAFIGILTLHIKEKLLEKILIYLVALAAGALLGGAFFHLIPEALDSLPVTDVFLYIIIGFVLFFLVEKVLHWRHCHEGKCEIHSFAYINLIGDSIHNLIDGLIIAAAFTANSSLGITTTIAMIFHEVPQELGDFGVLVYSGFSKMKAVLLNFITAVTAIIGGLLGYFLSSYIETSIPFLISFAAGGFIYISSSDLIPEIRKELRFKKYLGTFATFLIGILMMYLLVFIE